MLISPPGKGRRPAPIAYGPPRHLSESDIAAMWESGGTRTGARIKTLRYNHHLLAKAVASGKSLLECSRMTGLTVPRISDLKNDPAFQELVSFYAEELHEVYVDVHQRMAALGTSVLEELQERFEDAPDKFTKRELMDLFTTMADRSIPTAKGGPSPQQVIATGGGAGLALQINFVSPSTGDPEPLDLQISPSQTQAPAALPGNRKGLDLQISPEGGKAPAALMENREAVSPIPFDPYAPSPELDIDGEPFVPHNPSPAPSAQMLADARYAAAKAAVEKREAAERDAIRAALMAKRIDPNG